jgi:hypothetical protein
MNTNNCKNTKRIPGRILLAVIAAAFLSWTLPATAGIKTIVTGWDMGVVKWLDYGEYTFPGGNMHIQGHSGINLHLSGDPLHTGLLQWIMNLQFDENGDGVVNMSWRFEGGSFREDEFEYDDEDNLVLGEYIIDLFTPNGTVWEGNSHGWYNGDSVTYHSAGQGVEGEIEGWQVQVDSEGQRNEPLFMIITRLDPKAKK